jgi:VanZ family protein
MLSRTFGWRLLTIVWAVHMFWMSTESFGTEHTLSMLGTLLNVLHIHVSSHALWILNVSFRKLAHVTEYAVLGFLLSRSLGSQARFRSHIHMAALCIAVAAAYSLTDELHQSFVPGRGPSLIDCGIDVSGAVIAMILLYVLPSRLNERDQSFSPVKLS